MEQKKEKKLTASLLVAYLAVEHRGNWDGIFAAVKKRERTPDADGCEAVVRRFLEENHYDGVATIMDAAFPKERLLRETKPPFALFYKGRLPSDEDLAKAVAILAKGGMGRGTEYAAPYAERLWEKGKAVICVSKGLPTIIYPSGEKCRLTTLNAASDLVLPVQMCSSLSVFSLGWKGPEKGLVTFALDENKEVSALPHSIDDERGDMCNELIRQGALSISPKEVGLEDPAYGG